jgi:hypothetical protein
VGGYKGTTYATAEAGDYVFIRTKNRDLQIEWKDLFLDHNTGRIWKTSNGKTELFRDHTYLTVQILKNAGSDDVVLAQNQYGEFRDAFQRDATDKAKKIEDGLLPLLEAAALKRVQVRAFNTAQKRFERMVADCGQEEAGWERSAYDLFTQTKESVTGLSCEPVAGAKAPKTDLSQMQVDYLLKRMRDRSKAKTEAEILSFEPGCKANFTAMKFETFAALMCPKQPPSPTDAPKPADPPVQPDPVPAPTEDPSETPPVAESGAQPQSRTQADAPAESADEPVHLVGRRQSAL